MADILPENNYNPAHAEDLKWVEVSDGTTTAEACGVIADFYCDIYPQEDTRAPLYAQANDDGSFSNPMLIALP